jgi:hypothetical protein
LRPERIANHPLDTLTHMQVLINLGVLLILVLVCVSLGLTAWRTYKNK